MTYISVPKHRWYILRVLRIIWYVLVYDTIHEYWSTKYHVYGVYKEKERQRMICKIYSGRSMILFECCCTAVQSTAESYNIYHKKPGTTAEWYTSTRAERYVREDGITYCCILLLYILNVCTYVCIYFVYITSVNLILRMIRSTAVSSTEYLIFVYGSYQLRMHHHTVSYVLSIIQREYPKYSILRIIQGASIEYYSDTATAVVLLYTYQVLIGNIMDPQAENFRSMEPELGSMRPHTSFH